MTDRQTDQQTDMRVNWEKFRINDSGSVVSLAFLKDEILVLLKLVTGRKGKIEKKKEKKTRKTINEFVSITISQIQIRYIKSKRVN